MHVQRLVTQSPHDADPNRDHNRVATHAVDIE